MKPKVATAAYRLLERSRPEWVADGERFMLLEHSELLLDHV